MFVTKKLGKFLSMLAFKLFLLLDYPKRRFEHQSTYCLANILVAICKIVNLGF